MAFERPTLTDIVDRVQQDFVSRLQLSGAVLRRSLVNVFVRVIAGAAHMMHGHLDFVSRQTFADTAEGEYLSRIGSLFGVSLVPAAFATGTVVAWGTDGTTAPAGRKLVRSDGAEYTTDADIDVDTLAGWAPFTDYLLDDLVTKDSHIFLCTVAGESGNTGPTTTELEIPDGTVTWRWIAAGTAAGLGSVTASVAAAAGNGDIGTELAFESPVAGINATSLVCSPAGLSEGADVEGAEAYRARVISRMRSAPQGGSAADYVAWAKEVPGVTRAWVYPQELGAGTVTVRFVRDDDSSLIPDGAEVDTVQDYVDERRPVTAVVTVVAPAAAPVAFTVHLVPDTAATRAAVEAEIADLFRREAEPGVVLPLSHIRTAIGTADGVVDYTLTTPSADVSPTTGQLPTLGTITWS